MCKRVNAEIRKLALLHQDIYRLVVWPVIGIVFGALLWSGTLSRLSHEKEDIRVKAFKEATSLSSVYAQQLAWSLEKIDKIALHVKYDWEHSPGILHLEHHARAGLLPASDDFYVSVIDRNGNRLASTRSNALNGPDLATRSYFQAHKHAPFIGLLINEPVPGIRSGKALIRFTRRLNAADGSFDGIVVVSVEPGFFASFVEESNLNKSAFHAVRRSDGVSLASRAGREMGSSQGTLRSPLTFESDSGVMRVAGEHFIHGQARIVAWQKLTNYPVVALVGLSEDEIFAPYRKTERIHWEIAIAGSLLLLLVTITCIIISARKKLKKRQAEEVKKAYRLATDGAREGFYMVRPLYDRHGTIVDFVVEDCNECGASYYGTTRANLIGMTFARFSPSSYAQEVIALFCRAMETGFYEDEFRVPADSPLQVAWMHRRLVRSDDGLAVTLRDISDVKAHQEALARLANTDAVTALHNRHWLMHYLPAAVEQARSSNTMLALLFVDLDDFKNINDTLGHAAGDEMLQAAAMRLKSTIRPQDNVVRLGGDEFTVVMERIDSNDDVSSIAKHIVESLGQPFVLQDGSGHVVHASIGISLFPQHGNDGPALLKHADIAMYSAKANGKGHYRFYEPLLSDLLLARVTKEQALRRAIERDEFVLYYQPRVDTADGELRSMEALVRWNHPENGLISPNDFITIAEQTGLIVQLGKLVIKKACKQIMQWKAQNLPLVPVSVNVSSRQFNEGSLSAFITSCMAQYGIDASLIEIEITESCVIEDAPAVTAELAAIEALGLKLLVDDFGTGYSSLSQLQRLQVDVLKVDRAFTAQLGKGKEGKALFMAILSMAHVLGLQVVAEGVETMEQLRILQQLSCNEVQGYLISKPVPASEMAHLMLKRFLFPASASFDEHGKPSFSPPGRIASTASKSFTIVSDATAIQPTLARRRLNAPHCEAGNCLRYRG